MNPVIISAIKTEINRQNKTGVGITNIEQKDWQDIYYIKTDADAAYIVFYYNAKHIYSTVLSYSSNGEQDVKLVDFLSRL